MRLVWLGELHVCFIFKLTLTQVVCNVPIVLLLLVKGFDGRGIYAHIQCTLRTADKKGLGQYLKDAGTFGIYKALQENIVLQDIN